MTSTGALLVQARLPAAEGALVLRALEASREALRASRGAAGEGGASAGAGAASAETTQIGDALSDEDGVCELEHGPVLSPETARRLGCDASLVRILERDGRPLSIGRKTRALSPALKRALRSRDRTCRFPGCGQQWFLHAHHIRHWAQGGRTDLSNLIQLCSHHRLVHEGGYTVERRGEGRVRFHRPDGQPVPAAPATPAGQAAALPRLHEAAALTIDATTCVPCVHSQRMDLHWIADLLCEANPQLRALDAPPQSDPEPETGDGEPRATAAQAA